MVERWLFRLVALLLASWAVGANAQTATALAYGSPHVFEIPRFSQLPGLKVLTLDASGQPVAGATVYFTTNFCGAFEGYTSPFALNSNADGVVELPSWSSATTGTCTIYAQLSTLPPEPLVFVIAVDDTATVVKYFDATTSYTASYGSFVRNLAVFTVDENGGRVPKQSVTASASCGTFNGSTTATASSDLDGVAYLPHWTAPVSGTTCSIDVRLTSDPAGPPVSFTVQLTADGIPVSFNFTRPTHYTYPAGWPLAGWVLRPVDASGNGIEYYDVTVTASCGMFFDVNSNINLGTTVRTTTLTGVVVTPFWRAPETPGTCEITARFDSFPDLFITFTVDVGTPATALEYVDSGTAFAVALGGTAPALGVATLDDQGRGVYSQQVKVEATCGAFTGQPFVFSDASGIALLPTWHAPSSGAECVITASLASGNGTPRTFTITLIDPAQLTFGGIPRMGTTTASGASPSGGTIRLSLSGGSQSCTLSSATFTDPAVTGFTPLPAGFTHPFGMIEFQADNCGVGATTNFTLGLPQAAPAGAQWWQYGPTPNNASPHWYSMDTVGGGSKLSFKITDGARGDNDVTLNGSLSVRGMVLVPAGMSSSTSLQPSPAPGPPPSLPTTSRIGTSPAGGSITLSLSSGSGSCSLGDFNIYNPAATDLFNQPPAALAYARHGYVEVRADGCTSGGDVTFSIEFPEMLPATAQWWTLGPTTGNPANHWYPIPSTVDGKRITFTITDGGFGDDNLMANGGIHSFGMLGVPGGDAQDLWWAGAIENGWGLSIVQHADKLFANAFVYDAQGNPVWYVMPGGTWNPTHTAFTGALYLPKGSPFYAYDANRFDIGASVGTMTLTFSDANSAVFDYSIAGVSGHKTLTRIPFGVHSPPTDRPMADLWWAGPSQNGWGLAILQQHATLFGLWFTYDANGKATWFVMPNVDFVARDFFRGSIYRPEGSAWLGVPYDASRHKTVPVGTFNLNFTDTGATFGYSIDQNAANTPLSRIPF